MFLPPHHNSKIFKKRSKDLEDSDPEIANRIQFDCDSSPVLFTALQCMAATATATFKLIVLGDAGAGKTSILKRASHLRCTSQYALLLDEYQHLTFRLLPSWNRERYGWRVGSFENSFYS